MNRFVRTITVELEGDDAETLNEMGAADILTYGDIVYDEVISELTIADGNTTEVI